MLRDWGTYGDADLLEGLEQAGRRGGRGWCPSVWGSASAQLEDGLTFTLVAGSAEVATGQDAAQYLDGGPCVESALTGKKGGRGGPGRPG